MSFEPRDYLRHILVEVEYLLNQSQTLTYERLQRMRRCGVHSCAAWKLSRSGEEPTRRVPGIASRG